jgi:hypothetical protein
VQVIVLAVLLLAVLVLAVQVLAVLVLAVPAPFPPQLARYVLSVLGLPQQRRRAAAWPAQAMACVAWMQVAVVAMLGRARGEHWASSGPRSQPCRELYHGVASHAMLSWCVRDWS